MNRSSLRSSTAMYVSMQFLSLNVILTGKTPSVQIVRHVLFTFKYSQRSPIAVVAYQAVDISGDKPYPWVESAKAAAVSVLLAGGLGS